MGRMKTFLTYVLLIIGFFIVSMLLENGLLLAMYKNISGKVDTYYEESNSNFSIKNISARACNVNGYMDFDLINTTGQKIDEAYLKVDLYNKQELLADTEYISILNMESGESKTFNIKFDANNIEKFNISVVKNTPDKTNIINVLGWEIDLTNVFGLGIDLSNATIFGVKLKDIFSWENMKVVGSSAWRNIKWFLASIPWWGYAIGGGIVAWYLPAFYLFGIL